MGPIEGMSHPTLDEILAAHAGGEGTLLPILHAVQHHFGCIPVEAEAAIARSLNLSRAEVHGVASFYPEFTARPDPRPLVELCQGEACQARGALAVKAAAQAAAGQRVRLGTIYCLGLCSVGPSARHAGALYARLDDGGVVALVENAQ